MKKLPASIRVGEKRIRIRIDSEMESFGEYDHDEGEIRIAERVLHKPAMLRDTLRHEVLEATLCVCGLAWQDKFESEPFVRAMEETFFPAWNRISEKLNKTP